jgi:hypothetical protein
MTMEPTTAMILAGHQEASDQGITLDSAQIRAIYRAMRAAAPEAPSDAVCREIDDTARNGKDWLVWWPTVKLDDDGNLTDEVTGGTWLISEYQGHWVEPDCLNAVGEWFGDGEEYAAEPTHYMPLPPPPPRPLSSRRPGC